MPHAQANNFYGTRIAGPGGMFKSPATAVAVGTTAISLAGIVIGSMWFAYVADRKPRTLNAQWAKATAKYRAAQNQDPISNM